MNHFKLAALALLLLAGPAAGQYYGGKTKPHGHTTNADGGPLNDITLPTTGGDLTNVISVRPPAQTSVNYAGQYGINFTSTTGEYFPIVISTRSSRVTEDYPGCGDGDTLCLYGDSNEYSGPTIRGVDLTDVNNPLWLLNGVPGLAADNRDQLGLFVKNKILTWGNLAVSGQITMGGVEISTSSVVDSTKLPLSGGTMTGQVTTSSSMTAAGGFVGALTGAASLNVLKSGDTMTGPLTLSGSSLTVTGSAFSVGGSTFAINQGDIYFAKYGRLFMTNDGATGFRILVPNTGSQQGITIYGDGNNIPNARFAGGGIGVGDYGIPTITIPTKGLIVSGNTGIATSAPASTLQIGTSLNATTSYLQIDTLAADTAGPPATADCDAATEVGRVVLSTRYTATAEAAAWYCVQTGAASFAWYKNALAAP